MSARSVLTLLRFPYGLAFLPVTLFGFTASATLDPVRTLLILAVVHVFALPAIHGFNSYYDHDRGPIGGLAHPPRPTRGLLRASLALAAAGLAVAALASPWMSLGLALFLLAAAAYSWPGLRWKARPFIGLLLVALGEGAVVFLFGAWWSGAVPVLPAILGQHAAESLWVKGQAVAGPIGLLFPPRILSGAAVAALFVAGMVPLSQIYQHDEDRRRGDLTASRRLGLRGSFRLAGLAFSAAGAGLVLHFLVFDSALAAALAGAGQLPGVIVFLLWWRAAGRNPLKANHAWATRTLVALSAGLSVFFVLALSGLPRWQMF